MSSTVSSTANAGKRKASDSDSETTQDFARRIKDSSCVFESGSSGPYVHDGSTEAQSLSSPASSCQHDIDKCTSKWTSKTLDRLMVTYDMSETNTPTELIQNLSSDFTFYFSLMDRNMADRIEECKNRILTSSPFRHIDVDDISDLDTDRASALLFDNCNGMQWMKSKEWSIAQQSVFQDSVLEHFCKRHSNTDHFVHSLYICYIFNNGAYLQNGFRFHVLGEEFARQLLYMTIQLKEGQDLSEAMYLSLFQQFSGLLGCVSFSQPSLQALRAVIQNVEVKSTPDLVFPYFGHSKGSFKLMAVCKVKSDYEDDGESSPRKSRRQQKQQVIKHLNSDVIGQHGGQLLLHLPSTCKENCSGILGLIVQKTYVTFTYLSCTKKQYDGILSGKRRLCKLHPVIQYSRPYNFLKAEDRLEILQPFLTLGFLQAIPYSSRS